VAEVQGESGDGQGGKKFDIGKILFPLFLVVNLGGVGAGAFLTYQATLGYEPPALREPAAMEELEEVRAGEEFPESVLYTMPSFTVNLDGQPRRLIRLELTFEMLDKESFEEIVRNSPVVRDVIVKILNRKTFDDIESIQGKLFLKDQIAVALNQTMKSGVIKDIHFSELLVQ
jgi:flagellar FliL protein